MKKTSKLNNKVKYILIILVSLLIIYLVYFAFVKLFCDPYRGTFDGEVVSMSLDSSLTKEQAKEDLDYVMKMFRTRHPAWLEENNRRVESVENQYKEELENLNKSDSITVMDEWRSISRIMHELQDGHSRAYYDSPDLTYIDDFAQVKEYGCPVKINDEPIEQILDRVHSLFSYEIEDYVDYIFVEMFIQNKEYLDLYGIDTSEGVTFTFDTDEGPVDYHYDFVLYDQAKISEQEYDDKWVYYKISTDNNVGIFTLDSCNDNSEYQETLQSFFDDVDKAGVKNIIVDLRNNGGGNSYVANQFLKYVDVDGYNTWSSNVRFGPYLRKNRDSYMANERKEPQYSGNIYVLTSLKTYSAAMDFAMLVGDNNLGELIGEPSGNMPDSYGDCLRFCTPNSNLGFTVSFKKWFRVDQSKANEPLNPDYPCNADDAIDKALEIINAKK